MTTDLFRRTRMIEGLFARNDVRKMTILPRVYAWNTKKDSWKRKLM